MSLYYLILWNQVDILQKHFKQDYVHYAPLDEVLRYVVQYSSEWISVNQVTRCQGVAKEMTVTRVEVTSDIYRV